MPMHIRNAPTALMKGLGYARGYEYNPANHYARGCAQGYLPPELGAGRAFLDEADCEPGCALWPRTAPAPAPDSPRDSAGAQPAGT